MANQSMGTGRSVRLSASLALALITISFNSIAQEEAATPDAGAEDASETAATEETSDVSDEALATARLHFANGVDLLQSTPPNYQDAYRQFQLALEKSGGSWKVRGNLGLCALKLERDGEALVHYGEYLEKGGDEVDPQERAHIEKELLLLKGNLTTLQLSSSDSDARISVSRQGSSAPTQLYELTDGAAELGVRSGSFTITATSGEKKLVWETALSAGESGTHTFDFDAPLETAPAAPAATAAVQDEPQKTKPSTLRIIGFATAGAGVLAIGGGVVTGILSSNKESDAQDLCIDDICPEEAEAEFDSAKSLATVANILYISGGVLAATGVTLIVVGGNKPAGESALNSTPRPRLQLTPLATYGGGGLLASGHF